MNRLINQSAFVWSVWLVMHATLPAFGQPNPPAENRKNKADESALKKLNKAFDEFENEIDQHEKMAEVGAGIVDTYAVELEEEYRENHEALQQASEHGLDSSAQQDLRRRQKTVALYLWELRRLKPTIGSQDHGRNSLTMKLHRLRQQHRKAIQNKEAMQRLHALNERVSQMAIAGRRFVQRMPGRGGGQFFIVRPDGLADVVGVNDAPTQFKSGPIQTLRIPLQRILKLHWSEAALAWDRKHWDEPFAGKSLNDIKEEVARQLKDRGLELPSDQDNHHAFSMPPRVHNIVLLFQNLHYRANESTGGNHGTSFGGGGEKWRSSFETKAIRAEMLVDGKTVELTLREQETRRRLRVTSSDLELRVIYESRDHNLLLRQRHDGHVWLAESFGDEHLVASAKSFVELYATNPDLIEVSLFPLLDHLGFILPPMRFESAVVDRVLEKLILETADSKRRFEELLVQMDSPDYKLRDSATRELEDNLAVYLQRVNAAFRHKEHSLEVRTRLKRVLQSYESQSHALDAFVDAMNLTRDPAYLINLLGQLDAEHSETVVSVLESLTGNEFGADVAAWQQWLRMRTTTPSTE